MWGVSESREPIKGEFAKKILEEAAKIREKRLQSDYIANENFENKVREKIHNITIIDPNFDRFSLLMNTPLEDISLEDLQWASEQPFNSLTSKNIFLAEIERRKHES